MNAEKGLSARSWLSNPGNIITLVLAVVTLGSVVTNVFNDRFSVTTSILNLTASAKENSEAARVNAQQIKELGAKVDAVVEIMNKHLQWGEGRSATVEELQRRVDRLEKIEERRR